MKIRTELRGGSRIIRNHGEALRVRSTLRAGGLNLNHSEALRVRSTLRAGKSDKLAVNHNEMILG